MKAAIITIVLLLSGCTSVKDALGPEEPVHPEFQWNTDKAKGLITVTAVYNKADWQWLEIEYHDGSCNGHLNGRLLEENATMAESSQPIRVNDKLQFDTPCLGLISYVETGATVIHLNL